MDEYEEFHRIVEPLAAEQRAGRRMSPRLALFAAVALPSVVITTLWALFAIGVRLS